VLFRRVGEADERALVVSDAVHGRAHNRRASPRGSVVVEHGADTRACLRTDGLGPLRVHTKLRDIWKDDLRIRRTSSSSSRAAAVSQSMGMLDGAA
jgi:hypothetical protein